MGDTPHDAIKKRFWKTAEKMKPLNILVLIVGIIAAAVYPMLFLWMNNVNLIKDTGGIWATMGIMAGGALALFGLFCLIFRNMPHAVLSTVLAVLIFENGALLQSGLQAVVPRFRYWHTATILLVLAAVLVWLLGKLKQTTALMASKIVSLVFVGLIVINLAMAVPKIIANNTVENNTAGDNVESVTAVGAGTTGRNVYWLLFDEYSSNYVFENYFGYDNSGFTNALEEMGFNISYTSHNESNYSSTIAANIANLNYVVAYDVNKTMQDNWVNIVAARESAVVIPQFERSGYTIVGIGSAAAYGYTGSLAAASSASGVTMDGETVDTLFWKQTILSPFLESRSSEQADVLMSQLQYFTSDENIPQSNTFVLAHFTFPHAPFLFAADGSPLPASAYNDYSFYLGQCQFANGVILDMVENIIENDPDALIAVMSDHSLRKKAYVDNYEDVRNIFAALYNAGDETDIEGLSGLNIMITLLNTALGTTYDYIEPIVQAPMRTEE